MKLKQIKIIKGKISFSLTIYQLIKSFITKRWNLTNVEINVDEGDYRLIYEEE